LENYKKRWNEMDGRWSDEPRKDHTSEGADAFRQWAQAKARGMITPAGTWDDDEEPDYTGRSTIGGY
jgi:hypothetical protein